jgi:hypothetical protein
MVLLGRTWLYAECLGTKSGTVARCRCKKGQYDRDETNFPFELNARSHALTQVSSTFSAEWENARNRCRNCRNNASFRPEIRFSAKKGLIT